MLIDYVPGEECRIAVIEDGKLDEYYHERASNQSHVSNIYQGVVTNVEPSISAAFIDFGLERNGFLHITDVHPKYFPGEDREAVETVGHKTRHGDRPGIEKCFKKGDSVTVQVLKEGIGNKGPTVTSYLSVPGRFLVMMPDMQQLGVSRKVEDEDQRREMKQLLKSLEPPKEFGFIMRTAGLGQSKADLKKDLSYLVRLWKDIEERVAEGGAASDGRGRKKKGRRRARVTRELYTESDLVIRTIRDVFTPEVSRVIINHPEAAKRAHDFLAVSNPRAKSKVVFYDDPVPLFHRFGLERQIDNIGSRTVELPSGGALVIDPTEALVAVDVNSGRSRSAKTSESNAFETNKEAVDEVARQLRLRDLGGLVVLDLIDMYQQRHRRAIEARLKKNFLRDKARTRVGGISQFGMLELTRQRMRGSLTESVHQECAHCGGQGHTKSVESVVLNVMRQLAMVMQQPSVARLELTISPDVAFHMLNRKRAELVALEAKWQKAVTVRVGGGSVDYVQVTPLSEQGATLAPTAASGIPAETDRTFRDVASLEDADLEAWAAPLELILEEPGVLEGHAEAGGIDDAAPSADADSTDAEASGGKRSKKRRDREAERSDSETEHDESLDDRASDEEDRRRRRRRRRNRNRGGDENATDSESPTPPHRRSDGDEPQDRRPEPKPLPRGPHRDPVLDFEFDPEAHPLDRARAYAEHRLSTGAGDGPLSPAGEAAKAREALTETASIALAPPLAPAPGDADGPDGPDSSDGAKVAEVTEVTEVAEVAAGNQPDAPDTNTAAEAVPEGLDASGESQETEADDAPRRKRRRRRRGKRDRNPNPEGATENAETPDSDNRPRDEHGDIDGNVREVPGTVAATEAVQSTDTQSSSSEESSVSAASEGSVSKKRRSRKRKPEAAPQEAAPAEESAEADTVEPPAPKRKPRRRKRASATDAPTPAEASTEAFADGSAEVVTDRAPDRAPDGATDGSPKPKRETPAEAAPPSGKKPRSRSKRSSAKKTASQPAAALDAADASAAPQGSSTEEASGQEPAAPVKKKRRPRRKKTTAQASDESAPDNAAEQGEPA